MSNEIFSRLENLMKTLRMSFEEGTYTRAEMKAYAAAIGLAAEKMEDAFKNLFADTASGKGLALFLSMIGERPAETEEGTRQKIFDSLSAQRRIFTKSEFDEIISSFGQLTYRATENELVIDFGIPFCRDILEALSKLIKDIVPCTSIVSTGGSGQSLDAWESLGLRWYELDSLDLSFYALDRM